MYLFECLWLQASGHTYKNMPRYYDYISNKSKKVKEDNISGNQIIEDLINKIDSLCGD